METIFPREEKADLLFDKILKDPEACERLMQTFYGEIDSDLELVGGYLPPEQFAKALFCLLYTSPSPRDKRHCLMPIKTGI